ncbi:hypothetical protein D9M73_242700 [compost metagenome]
MQPSPSRVVISRPAAPAKGMTQERAATPSMITVHAPHSPRPQPYLGPFRHRSLRRISSSGVSGMALTSTGWPLTCREMVVCIIGSSLEVACATKGLK